MAINVPKSATPNIEIRFSIVFCCILTIGMRFAQVKNIKNNRR